MIVSSTIANLCIYVLTWNVGTNSPKDLSLSNVLSLNGTSNCPNQQLPDIYVIGLQEVNVNAQSQVLGIFQDNPWIFKIRDFLNPYEYEKIETENLQGLLIMMFSQRQHIPHIRDIETENTRTGLGGLWGNKGAVSIRMSLYGTGVTFVAAHLAAHDKNLKERIEDYNQIVNNHHYKVSNYRNIFDHDFVFWFGDLNFRLSGKDSAYDIETVIKTGVYSELWEQDQLRIARESGNAFSLMEEQIPQFAPTFKFNEGTSNYNLKRRPAWCDRIMYRVQTDKYPYLKLNITQVSYKSHPDYILSDHKPVSGEFLYSVIAETQTADEVHEMTHGSSEVHYASVIILLLSVFVSAF